MTKWKCVICYDDADVLSDASSWCARCHRDWTASNIPSSNNLDKMVNKYRDK